MSISHFQGYLAAATLPLQEMQPLPSIYLKDHAYVKLAGQDASLAPTSPQAKNN